MSAAAPDPVELARALVRCPSVTPADAGALGVLETALVPLGFACERMRFEEPGTAAVDNLFARVGDPAGPHLCFAGHTDVVPPGDRALWRFDPFAGELADGRVWGRGACDMKGAIAAFTAAASRFLGRRGAAGFGGAIGLLITGDEEADAVNGTRKVLAALAARGERIDGCLVGEPTSAERLGDTLKIGRRGSLVGRLTVRGAQGHTAYPHQADNPLPRLVAMLHAVTAYPIDARTPHFEPSSLAITSIDVGNPATNVIPAEGRAVFNIRFNDRHTGASLEEWLRRAFDGVGGAYELDLRIAGESFLTPPGPLVDLVAGAVERVTGARPALSTSGGTSDARFIKDHAPVVELGLVNATIHRADENAPADDIRALSRIYEAVLDASFPARG